MLRNYVSGNDSLCRFCFTHRELINHSGFYGGVCPVCLFFSSQVGYFGLVGSMHEISMQWQTCQPKIQKSSLNHAIIESL